MVGLGFMQGCRLGFLPGWYYRLSSADAQGHCLSSLAMWGQRLYLSVEQGCRFGSFWKQGWRMSSLFAWVNWPGFLLGRAVNLLPCIGGAVEQTPWSVLLVGWGPKSDRTAH